MLPPNPVSQIGGISTKTRERIIDFYQPVQTRRAYPAKNGGASHHKKWRANHTKHFRDRFGASQGLCNFVAFHVAEKLRVIEAKEILLTFA